MSDEEEIDTIEVELMQQMSIDQLDRWGDATQVMEEVKAEQPKMDREFAEQNRLNERLTWEEWRKRFPLMARFHDAIKVQMEILDDLKRQWLD